MVKNLQIYQDTKGGRPFVEWLEAFKDSTIKARILKRIRRMEQGNLGDCQPIGEGLSELRLFFGAGYTGYILGKLMTRLYCCCVGEINQHKTRILPKQKNIGENIMGKTMDFKEYLIESLKDEETAKAYIAAALEDYENDQKLEDFLLALKDVAVAKGGMATLAEKTHLSRETLYRTLSSKGNPRLDTLASILQALGFRLTIETAHA